MFNSLWITQLFDLETIKIVLGPIVALLGVFLTKRFNEKRQDKLKNQDRIESVGKSLSRVLQASSEIIRYDFNTHTGKEEILFEWKMYSELVRPALFDCYIYLPQDIQDNIQELDQIAWKKRDGVRFHDQSNYSEEMYEAFTKLVERIQSYIQQHPIQRT